MAYLECKTEFGSNISRLLSLAPLRSTITIGFAVKPNSQSAIQCYLSSFPPPSSVLCVGQFPALGVALQVTWLSITMPRGLASCFVPECQDFGDLQLAKITISYASPAFSYLPLDRQRMEALPTKPIFDSFVPADPRTTTTTTFQLLQGKLFSLLRLFVL